MRRSTVLSLSPQLVFPDVGHEPVGLGPILEGSAHLDAHIRFPHLNRKSLPLSFPARPPVPEHFEQKRTFNGSS